MKTSDIGEIAMLGVALRVCRKRHKLTQVELAEITGVTHPYISRIENGKQAASVYVLAQLGRAIPLPEILREWAGLLTL